MVLKLKNEINSKRWDQPKVFIELLAYLKNVYGGEFIRQHI